MRSTMIVLLVLALPADVARAQSSRFSVTPHVGYSVIGTFYDGTAEYEGVAFDIEINPQNQFVVGGDLGFDLRRGWALYGQVAYGRGESQGSFCVSGGACETGSTDLSSLLLGAGIGRQFRIGAGRVSELGVHAGGTLLRLSFEDDGDSDVYSNPGVLAGLDLGIALTQRATFVVGAEGAVTRSDTKAFEEDFEAVEGGDLRMIRAWTNMARFTAAVRFRF